MVSTRRREELQKILNNRKIQNVEVESLEELHLSDLLNLIITQEALRQ